MSEKRRRLEPLRLDPRRSGAGPLGAPPANVPSAGRASGIPVGAAYAATHPAPLPPVHSGTSPWVIIVIAATSLVVLVAIGGGAFLLLRGDEARPQVTYPSRPPTATPPAVVTNDGTDAKRPILPDADKGFIDARGGWGWGDKCWLNLKAGKWGWAKAECDQGMAMNPASPQPRASLLYNAGLVAKAAGKIDEARADFTSSLALRENADVRAALNSLPR